MQKLNTMKFLYLYLGTIVGFGLLLFSPASANAEPTDTTAVPQYQSAKPNHTIHHVRCNRRAKLGAYLKRANGGERFYIYGICKESVLIDKDNVQLIGIDDAGIDGSSSSSEGVVIVDGARGIVLENLTIENGSDQGLLATHSAQGMLKNLVVKGNNTVGIAIDRSHFDISNVQVSGNGSSGMDVFTSSSVVVRGNISASNNSGDGIAVNGKSFFELRGATVTANNNLGSGVSIINDSRLQIFSFPEAQGSSITADGNGFAGLGLLGAAMGVVGSQYFGSGANVISASNNVIGFFMPAGAILSPHGTAKFIAQYNVFGMLLEDGASALIVGGLDLSQNNVGIDAQGAGTLNIVSVPANPSSALNNQLDVKLGFGTRATFNDVDTLSVQCDTTVLIRGTVMCP